MSNEFKKKLAALTMATTFGITAFAGLTSCEPNSISSSQNNGSFENNKDVKYFGKDEIFPAYCYIKEKLKENLSNEEIIEIGNIYKKLAGTIYHLDDINSNVDVLDELPTMKGLFTDMPEEIADLIYDNSLVLLPKEAFEFQKRRIVEEYLTSTDSTRIEQIKIAQIEDENNKYCVLSNNQVFFEMYVSTEREGTLYFSKKSELTKDANEIYKKSASITNVDKSIPVIDVNDLEEDMER